MPRYALEPRVGGDMEELFLGDDERRSKRKRRLGVREDRDICSCGAKKREQHQTCYRCHSLR